MLNKEDIKDGNLVYNTNEDKYYEIFDVGNAVEKGDRGYFDKDSDELSYSIKNIISGKIVDGICQDSQLNNQDLTPADINALQLYLKKKELKARIKVLKTEEKLYAIQQAMNNYKTLNNK